MHPQLFRKLVENKVIANEVEIEALYDVFDEDGNSKKVKGTYKLNRMYMDPFRFVPTLELLNSNNDIINIEPENIKKVNGDDLAALAAKLQLRVDGASIEAPKRRGRKPKAKNIEEEDYELDEE